MNSPWNQYKTQMNCHTGSDSATVDSNIFKFYLLGFFIKQFRTQLKVLEVKADPGRKFCEYLPWAYTSAKYCPFIQQILVS